MTLTIAGTTFDQHEYDERGDVLYLSVGDPREAPRTCRPLREPYVGPCARLLRCRGERNRVAVGAHDRHTSPNHSYGTPLRRIRPTSLLVTFSNRWRGSHDA